MNITLKRYYGVHNRFNLHRIKCYVKSYFVILYTRNFAIFFIHILLSFTIFIRDTLYLCFFCVMICFHFDLRSRGDPFPTAEQITF